MRIRHIARFCDAVGVSNQRTSSATRWARSTCSSTPPRTAPLLPARSMAMICGGGEIQRNEYSAALYDYDATLTDATDRRGALLRPGLSRRRRYVQRRYESSIAPGAWEALAAARFRRPGLEPPPLPSSKRPYRPHRRADAGRRGCRRQVAARRLGRRDRRADPVRPLGRHRESRPLPADRTARRGQRTAVGLPRRCGSRRTAS